MNRGFETGRASGHPDYAILSQAQESPESYKAHDGPSPHVEGNIFVFSRILPRKTTIAHLNKDLKKAMARVPKSTESGYASDLAEQVDRGTDGDGGLSCGLAIESLCHDGEDDSARCHPWHACNCVFPVIFQLLQALHEHPLHSFIHSLPTHSPSSFPSPPPPPPPPPILWIPHPRTLDPDRCCDRLRRRWRTHHLDLDPDAIPVPYARPT